MTRLSVNVNKIALIRNSRGTNYPNLIEFVEKLLKMDVKEITVHPRQDQRHIKYDDVYELTKLIERYPHVELNVEGYPDKTFMELIKDVKPAQCTLVPDSISQLTSDHGWKLSDFDMLLPVINELRQTPSRIALFLEPIKEDVVLAEKLKVDAIEIYTEHYASRTTQSEIDLEVNAISEVCDAATKANLIINAGHDLNLENLGRLLSHCEIAEVSIGHAFTIECIHLGLNEVLKRYLELCEGIS